MVCKYNINLPHERKPSEAVFTVLHEKIAFYKKLKVLENTVATFLNVQVGVVRLFNADN